MPTRSRTPNAASVGREILRRRAALGLTQEEVAARARITAPYLGSVERGPRNISLEMLLDIADALETSAAELVGGEVKLGARGLEVAEMFDRASPGLQGGVLALLRETARLKR